MDLFKIISQHDEAKAAEWLTDNQANNWQNDCGLTTLMWAIE